MMRSLFMVELTVADWPAALAWYVDLLGLSVVMKDEANRFALLSAGSTRLALKAGTPVPGTTRLSFEVSELDQALDRLAQHGVMPEGPLRTSAEGYRRAVLRDRDDHLVNLFEWLPGAPGQPASER